ncbi:hypothetical protein LINPERHAP1_LOCUS28272, partial [Linum perenne]
PKPPIPLIPIGSITYFHQIFNGGLRWTEGGYLMELINIGGVDHWNTDVAIDHSLHIMG